MGNPWRVRRSSIGYRLLALCTALFCICLPGTVRTIAANAPNLSQTSEPVTLIEQGKTFYEAGQYAQAITVLQQAAQAYKSKGDTLRQAMALSNLSLAYQQLGQWQEAQQVVEQSLQQLGWQAGERGSDRQPSDRLQILAQTLDVQGRLQLARGQAEAALAIWQQSAAIYAQLNDRPGETRSRINQAQALQTLGLYRRALSTLEDLNQSLQTQPDSLVKAVALRSLGDALQVVGKLPDARTTLEQSLTIAQSLQSNHEISLTQFSLGNTARAQAALPINQDDAQAQAAQAALIQTALNYYQQAASTSTTPLVQLQAQLNQLSLLVERDRREEARTLASQIQPRIDRLPPSRATIYAQINFAQSLVALGTRQPSSETAIATTPSPRVATADDLTAARILGKAAQQATQIGDPRAESYALGTLGHLYEITGQRSDARTLTERALSLSQAINAADIAYRWQWQLGRLLKAQNELPGAIAAYDSAVAILQSIRSDLVAINQNVQFSFRESVEPVYRESVALLLQSDNPDAEILDKARQRMESLQLAELDNFFREACLNSQSVALDDVVQENPNAAIVYLILLPDDQPQMIVKMPGKALQRYVVNESSQTVEQIAETLRRELPSPTQERKVRTLSQKLYTLLIQPFEPALPDSVNTLVFVLDGALRSVPMAALYDGQQYLVEKYAVALNLGLQLRNPKPLERSQLQALAAGVIQPPSEYSQYAPLEGIKTEFQLMEAAGVRTQEILEFTKQKLEQEINALPFSVVHLATHGRFSSQAEDTFILAADRPIYVAELDTLLRSRDQTRAEAVELLVLSACQTATGDNRATLGLAGITVRAGARSTLASLWQIDDTATALFIGEFYRELLKPGVTKAEAVRRAQLSLRKNPDYQKSSYWSPYVLVGNWL